MKNIKDKHITLEELTETVDYIIERIRLGEFINNKALKGCKLKYYSRIFFALIRLKYIKKVNYVYKRLQKPINYKEIIDSFEHYYKLYEDV